MEQLCHFIHSSISPEARVEWNQRIKGKRSKSLRQLDITLRHRVGLTDIFIVVECKDYKVRVGSKTVESFVSLLNDVGAQKGIMVSSKGYSEGAKNWARDANIDLYSLDEIIEGCLEKVHIPVLVEFVGMAEIHFSMGGELPEDFEKIFKPGEDKTQNLALYDSDGGYRGTAGQVLMRDWNDGKIRRQPTEFPARVWNASEYYLKHPETGKLYRQDLGAAIWIKRDFFLGQLEMESFKHYRDELSGELVGKLFRAPGLTMNYLMLARTWEKIADLRTLKVKPAFMFSAEDYYHFPPSHSVDRADPLE